MVMVLILVLSLLRLEGIVLTNQPKQMHTSVSYVDLSSPGKQRADDQTLLLNDEELGSHAPLLSSPPKHGFIALGKFESLIRIGIAVVVCLSWTFVSSVSNRHALHPSLTQ